VHRAVEVLRDFGNRKAVEIPQRQRGAVVRPELFEHFVRARPFESLVYAVGLGFFAGNESQIAGLARLAPPMIDELVARDADQPRDREIGNCIAFDRLHGREKRLGGDVFGDRLAADPHAQVPVHLGERAVVHREQGHALIRHRCVHAAATFGPRARDGIAQQSGPPVCAWLLLVTPNYRSPAVNSDGVCGNMSNGSVQWVGTGPTVPSDLEALMRRIVQLSMAVVLIAALGACSSSGGGSKGLSKSEFIKKAEAICVAADAKSSKVSDTLESGNPSVAQVKSAYTDQLIPILRGEVHDLGALQPPAADQATIKKMLDDLSAGVDEAKANVEAAQTQADLSKITEPAGMQAASVAAKAYGLPTCGAGG
jgi:hypothetical protein